MINEVEIEDSVIGALSFVNNVTATLPSPKMLEDLPLMIVSISEGTCTPLMMNDNSVMSVDATMVIDVLTFDKMLTNQLANQSVAAVHTVGGVYKIRLESFTNSIDSTGQKPIYVKELRFSVKFKETYAI